ncbi:Protein of unknown function [Pyronema omphalodes CBS 100304]|uniref:Uncharacterized protein n=1 Tax=Pyronema omphalodes (strain CBS 100304) TaxID=1076935 RepID=U4KWK4_PYROM|nr:Protein of unknown function [Pyronema omphalodes CBS 100304]
MDDVKSPPSATQSSTDKNFFLLTPFRTFFPSRKSQVTTTTTSAHSLDIIVSVYPLG